MMTTMSFSQVYVTPAMEKTFPVGSTFGTAVYPGPFQPIATSSRMNETPIAVISGASRGAERRGR